MLVINELKMLYEHQQQQQQQQIQPQMMRKKVGVNNNSFHERRKSIEEDKFEIVDLSGLSLECLPNPSLNLATVCKLDLSNNNLQVYFFNQFPLLIIILTLLIIPSLLYMGFFF